MAVKVVSLTCLLRAAWISLSATFQPVISSLDINCSATKDTNYKTNAGKSVSNLVSASLKFKYP